MLSYYEFERRALINVFCENKGWLFEDLKREISDLGAVPSNDPIKEARAWICIRSSEAYKSPDKSRTLLQIHDVKNKVPLGFAKYSYVHPYQMRKSGIKGAVNPIGSRDIPYENLPDKPTIGFFCREYGDLKRSRMFAEAVLLARKECSFNVLMIGGNLNHIKKLGKYENRGANENDYQRIDALVTCSISPMIPISVYESLASGRAVISTPREWLMESPAIKEAENTEDMAESIIDVVTDRKLYKPVMPYNRKTWAITQYEEALKLCK